MAESTAKEPAANSTTEAPSQESTTSNAAVEELKKEFARNNQHNVPRDKREAELTPRRMSRRPNKKEYQRSRGRNKR